LGNVEVALHQAEASLAILQEENDEWGIANCLMQLKFIAEVKGEYTQSYALGEEGVRRIRTTGDRWCLSHHLNEHFWLVWDSGETNKARLLFEQNLEIIREFADRQGEARMLRILADLALYHGKIDRALAYLDECSPIELGLGNEGLIPWMILRARIALWQGNLSDAQSAYEAAQRSCQEVDSPYYHCLILEGMGLVKYYQGEYLLAERNLHEALLFADRARSQLMSNQTRRWIWRDLGDVSRQQDKLDDAMGWYRKSLGLMQWMGCQPFMPDTIEAIAKVAGILGQNQRAVRLFAASQAAREWLEIPVPAVSQPDYERNLRGIHKAMGEVTFNAAWEEGKKMTLEQALELAMEKPPD
jgi:tetratricopeptide (TPR) repeat protein